MSDGMPIEQIASAFENLIRISLDLDEAIPVRVTLARVHNGVRIQSLDINGAPASTEAWTELRALGIVYDAPKGPPS